MKLFISGCAGYVGSQLTTEALGRGHTVVGLDAGWYGWDGVIFHQRNSRFALLEKDLLDVSVDDVRGCDAVLHLAAVSNDPTADGNPALSQRVNVVGTHRLAQVCLIAKVPRLVYAGSASVYDGAAVADVYHLDTATPLAPLGAYSQTKYQGEQLLREHAWAGFRPVIFRQGTVYGDTARMRFDLVVNAMVRDAVCRGVITLHRPGTQHRPLVSVADVVTAHLWAATADLGLAHHATYNLVGTNQSIAHVAHVVAERVARHGASVDIQMATAPGRTRDYRVGGTPPIPGLHRFDLAEVIDQLIETVQWLQERGLDPYDPRYDNLAVLRATGRVAA